jgi:hypothetical protein
VGRLQLFQGRIHGTTGSVSFVPGMIGKICPGIAALDFSIISHVVTTGPGGVLSTYTDLVMSLEESWEWLSPLI